MSGEFFASKVSKRPVSLWGNVRNSTRTPLEPRGVDEAGMRELVEDDGVALANHRWNGSERGGIAAAENQGSFLFLPRSELFLQRENGGIRAGDQARRARARAALRRGLLRGFDQGGMTTCQSTAGCEIKHSCFRDAQSAAQVSLFEFHELAVKM